MSLAVAGPIRGYGQGEIVLEDQYGREDGPSRHRGETLVLLYAEPPALRKMKAWELAILEEAQPPPRLLRGVDARSVKGRKTVEEVRARLQKNVPPEISILIDWEGDLPRAYALPDAEVTVAVLDPRGKVCDAVAGAVSPERLARVRGIVSAVTAGGECP